MLKRRLIAVLLVDRGQIVQTRRFKRTNPVGSPFTAVDFFNGWTVDEIAVLEISHGDAHLGRFTELVEELSRRCFVPLSVGGKICDLERVRELTRLGADKVIVNTAAVERPGFVAEVASTFGSQCIVVSLDARPDPVQPSGYRVVVDNGRRDTELDALAWARDAVSQGAGEILVNSLDHDGDRRGYDLRLVRTLAESVPAPVIAMGGVGSWEHLVEGIREGRADAVAAGNIFHYTEHSTKKAKEFMLAAGLPVRPTSFYRVAMPRRPRYRPF